ncbi:MAG TPA: bifunctional DNA-formamidopyrimidine glycosylase/DNA-(apurinic or apyrimidinic site) lyase [Candidatus Agrococcus pullicola]|uniref:Formamidopyrimidine-DNA glycosylase n=1 Tax=Candidatus Agrococcus pullicola TaxID=2838429 RepID=A0A9D1YTC9_9MICO|nr:bifunctional DNA-formamidopyrimidine glycosylase/DNA-(apurinic or apyrimidinic site) lyase [Candidatus Agrococcus pullicola]
MPELPEVEVVRLGLLPALTDARVLSVEVLDERSIRRHDGDSAHFEASLVGRRMREPRRRGKFLWVPLEGAEALVVHLGMSGQMLVREVGAMPDRHARIRLVVESRDGREYEIRFADQRIFGGMAVRAVDGEGVPDQVAHIALDPIDDAFDPAAVVARLRVRSQSVKAALLDQQLISGIGNIYADEALWRARLHYLTPGKRVSERRGLELLAHVQDVLDRALVEGGTSFDTQYVNVNGESGYFAHSLNAYGQHGKPCPRCGAIIVREKWSNRSSHRCPKCQRRR